tara:strand:+ start:20026 stop:20400 length:375 start_codon:yes stop_codon:yes gene_type:complete
MVRYFYLGIGFLFVGIAFIGVFVPGIPTTINVLVAAWAFSKSSNRFEKWLLQHKIFGPLIKDWQKYRGISRIAKIKAIIFIMITFLTTSYFLFPLIGDVIFNGFAIALSIFLATRPEPPVLAKN